VLAVCAAAWSLELALACYCGCAGCDAAWGLEVALACCCGCAGWLCCLELALACCCGFAGWLCCLVLGAGQQQALKLAVVVVPCCVAWCWSSSLLLWLCGLLCCLLLALACSCGCFCCVAVVGSTCGHPVRSGGLLKRPFDLK
jgi:hypothetical protein